MPCVDIYLRDFTGTKHTELWEFTRNGTGVRMFEGLESCPIDLHYVLPDID